MVSMDVPELSYRIIRIKQGIRKAVLCTNMISATVIWILNNPFH